MKSKAILWLSVVLCFLLAGCGSSTVKPETLTAVQIDYASAKVSYLGPEGTYTQEACQKFFDEQGDYQPYETVAAAVQALSDGDTNYAVIPQENTIGGAVTDYLDVLIAHPELSVVGEVELPISQNLLVREGTELKDIKTVYSHKQGIAQGREWLEANLPEADVVEVSSTAEGARMVSEGDDPSCAAIASAGCAEVYDLKIFAADIQNNDKNKTRFYVLSKDAPATAPAGRLVFIATGPAEELPALMAEMETQKMTLVALHDRPQKTELGQYDYVIECSDSGYAAYIKLMEKTAFQMRYLGSFDVK